MVPVLLPIGQTENTETWWRGIVHLILQVGNTETWWSGIVPLILQVENT